ncbi:hypothetical protein LTR10_010291 [Elasticomyces elasticus]|nr:hypothetical protein LTR10_010291 [Elasticomyces elasticus]KAK4972196.1 hypothetical protein LTR42_006702 [Elasticomyces elasticus]KAK5715555.1 hypothetical protein LTR15_010200 [Elasticomyces elasticus]
MQYTVLALGLALGVSAMPSPYGHSHHLSPRDCEEPSDESSSISAGLTTATSSYLAPIETSYFPATNVSSSSSSAAEPEMTIMPISSSGSSTSGGSLPASSGSSALGATQTIAPGESFDGGMYVYDRGVSCTGQAEGGDSDAVFIIENGGSLSNVIIGPNQIEGVHCEGACTLTNVWWSAVCEDAFTIKKQAAGEITTITGGGAFGAEDKVLQHNGGGTMSVSGFTVDNFGKLYRSCGNCDEMYERHVIFSDVTATEGKSLAGINSNYGDTATFTNVNVSGVKDICVTYTGNDSGDEPEKNGSGPSDSCIYSESDITEL